MNVSFSAAIFTGGPFRLDITSKSISSLDNQNYGNLQKILVNGDGNELKIPALQRMGHNFSDWTIINFPVDTFERKDIFSLHRWPGQAALQASKNDYFFTMNDDDFLAEDFFERMARLFTKYPGAVTGMGLPVSYIHETGEVIITRPRNCDWRTRPEVESGISHFRKVYSNLGQYYNPNPGFQFVSKTDYVREVKDTFFSTGGFPDHSFQSVLIRGETVFDSKALMYWGRHNGQEHNTKTLDHAFNGIYKELYESVINVNTVIFDRYLPNSRFDKKLYKKYFNEYLVQVSMNQVLGYLSIGSRIRNRNFKSTWEFSEFMEKHRFPILMHLGIFLAHPLFALKQFLLNGKHSIIHSLKLNTDAQKWS
jgi:hypothetical protein